MEYVSLKLPDILTFNIGVLLDLAELRLLLVEEPHAAVRVPAAAPDPAAPDEVPPREGERVMLGIREAEPLYGLDHLVAQALIRVE